MIRIAALLALVALALPAAAQDGPALKARAAIAGEIVRIGDLVDNAGAVADVAIFRAPDLGQTGSVSASRVVDAVRPHQIIGLDTRGLAEVAVTRLSRTITPKDIEARIVQALAGQYGAADAKNLAVTFDNPMRTLHVEPGAQGDIINVLNVQTKRTVQATVSGPGRVSVLVAATPRPAANVVAARPSFPNSARLRTE